MFEYEFMRNTLVVSFMLSIMIPLIGIVIVNRKTSMIGDALSHVSLAGVGIGLIFGFDPVIGAIIVCIIGAFSIEKIREMLPQYGDMATAVIMSTGLGVAAILSDFAPGGNTFEAYLFGSISSVSKFDIVIVGIMFVLVFIFSISMYGGLLYIAVDPNLARVGGVRVKISNSIFTLLTAITVALGCKIVGALLVASLIALPVASALIISRSYRQTCISAVILGIIYMMSGITISYYNDVRPGGAVVVIAVIGMIITTIYANLRKAIRKEA